jgi:serine protease Do
VQEVTPMSPAERAGLRPYDVIVALDGRAIATGDELIGLVASRRPGEPVTMQVSRDGRALTALVKLAERPLRVQPVTGPVGSRASRTGAPRLGLSVRDLESAMAIRLGVPRELHGVFVWRVDGVSAAFEAEIERGDVILEVNRQVIRSLADYQHVIAAAKAGDLLTLYVYKSQSSQRRLSTIRVD